MSRTVIFRYLFSTVVICFGAIAHAQPPVLPDIVAASDKGINVISWTCQYEGLKSISVQRSSDSLFNYVTIGYVEKLKKGQQAYIDGHPSAGNNWYRLYIAFSSDLTWYSNIIKVVVDSAALLNASVIPPNESLQKYASSVQISEADIIASTIEKPEPAYSQPNQAPTDNTRRPNNSYDNHTNNNTVAMNAPPKPSPKLNLNIPKSEEVNQLAYIKSRHVFTNPFTGHVTLELPDDRQIYAIQFFAQKDERTAVLDIPRIRQTKVIIDKKNFQGKGMYKFVLYRGSNKIEEGYISIF